MSLYSVRTVRMKAGKATVRTYKHRSLDGALVAFLNADRNVDVERVDLVMDATGRHDASPAQLAAWLTEPDEEDR